MSESAPASSAPAISDSAPSISSSGSSIRVPEGIKLPDGTRWEGHHVSIEKFEGPLDLLLFLVREKKMEITDISISAITDQFIEYVKLLEQSGMDTDEFLDSAGDFLVMAAVLIQIKLRELLPADEEDIEEDEISKEELMRLLQEYERFKAAAETLEDRKKERDKIFFRRTPLTEFKQEEVLKVDLTRLLEAFRKVLKMASDDTVQELARASIKIDDCMMEIRGILEEVDAIRFEELFESGGGKQKIIATFLALLELMKLGELVVTQAENFGAIWVRRPPSSPPKHQPL